MYASKNPVAFVMVHFPDTPPLFSVQSPRNLDTVAANKPFTVRVKINNLQSGNFVNSATNYYAAPAQVNSDGVLVGHCHIVIEPIDSLTTTTVTDPAKFTFFALSAFICPVD